MRAGTSTGATLVVLCAIVLALFICGITKRGGTDLGIRTGNSTDQLIGNHTITLDSGQWSEEINLGISRPLKIHWGAVSDDTAFVVKINGGKSEGGVEYPIPARRDWKRLGWKAPFFSNMVVRVRFALTPRQKQKQLVYSIEPAR